MVQNVQLKHHFKSYILNVVSLVVLAPIFFGVFAFCPFRLPYIYCAICPRRCPWYHIRGYIVLAAIVLNLKNNMFCNRLCPFGTVQIFLSKMGLRKFKIPRFLLSLKHVSVLILLLLIIMTFHPQMIIQSIWGIDLDQIFITNMRYILLVFFVLGIMASLFSYRFFCYSLCPIRALSTNLNFFKPEGKAKEK
ncbi:MAG: 4Fe-4S binding protein [Candidatus Omnitrophica bacterium]|nr:4Fe-4S binding protein [Candidatus Omnitrophota bacterium]